MTTYCPTCGSLNRYSGVKPKKCSACDELLEPKPAPPRQEKAKRVRYVEIEDDDPPEVIEAEEEFHLDPRSFKFEKFDSGLLTVKQLRESGGGFERGGVPEGLQDVKNEVLAKMLRPDTVKPAETRPPPEARPRPTVRRMPSKLPPPPSE